MYRWKVVGSNVGGVFYEDSLEGAKTTVALDGGTVLPAYDSSPVCPRCGSGWPICVSLAKINDTVDHVQFHDLSCGLYEWSDDVCDTCKGELWWK